MSIIVSESPMASIVRDTAVDTAAHVRSVGSSARAKRPPEEEAVMSVMIGTIHTGPILDKSREFCPIITYTRPKAIMQDNTQSSHHNPHKAYRRVLLPVPQSRLTVCGKVQVQTHIYEQINV
jgi:hypothetical protein